jgi:hypothetical protein
MPRVLKVLPPLLVSSVLVLVGGSSDAALLFYEDFNSYGAGALNGQGGWNSNGALVQTSTYSSGSTGAWDGTHPVIPTGGDRFIANGALSSNLFDRVLPVTVTNTFVPGTTTWLSYLEYNGNNGSVGRHNLAIGAAPLTGAGGVEMAGQGIGVSTSGSNGGRATYWTPAAGLDDNVFSTESLASGRPIFVVAKIDWAAGGSNDTITIARWNQTATSAPNLADWNALTSAEKPTISADLDQSTFDTLSLETNNYGWIDDIRIATDFDSVVSGTNVVPEPSSALILTAVGLLGLIGFTRRKP